MRPEHCVAMFQQRTSSTFTDWTALGRSATLEDGSFGQWWITWVLPLIQVFALPVLAAAFAWVIRAATTGTKTKYPQAEALRTEALTGFRCLMTLWVFLVHMCYLALEGSGSFIVLAGCVLSLSRPKDADGTKAQSRLEPRSFLSFVAARYLRIMPMFWIASLSVKPWMQRRHEPDELPGGLLGVFASCAHSFVTALTTDPGKVFFGMHPEAEEWFVRTIMVCYVFFPFLERLILGPPGSDPPSRGRLFGILGGAIATKIAIIAVVVSMRAHVGTRWNAYLVELPWLGKTSLYQLPFLRVPDFAMGAVIPHLADPQAPRWLPICSDCLFLAVVWMSPYSPDFSFFQLITDFQIHTPVFAFALWGFCFAGRPSPVGQLLECYPAWFAKCSYGIYLFHLPVAMSLGWLWNPQPWNHTMTIFAGAAGLAWVVAVLVEEPIDKFVKAFIR